MAAPLTSARRCSPRSLAAWLSSMFRAKFVYETIIHANRFFMPIDFPLSCVDPWTTASALAMMHLARFQEFKVPSTFGQVLFETVDKVIPYGHVGNAFRRRKLRSFRTVLHSFQAFSTISDSSRSAWRARSMAVAIEDTGVRVRQMQSLNQGSLVSPTMTMKSYPPARCRPDAG